MLLSIGELVARQVDRLQGEGEADAKTSGAMRLETMRPFVVEEVAVVCISSGDAADLLANQMLSLLLERASYKTVTLNADALSEPVLAALSREEDTLVVVSALPLFALAEVRAVCLRIRGYLPRNRIAVALWANPEENEDTLSRLASCRPDAVFSSLISALQCVSAWQEATQKG